MPAVISTADISAETLLGAAGMRLRQPDVERDDARFHAKADKEQHEHAVSRRPDTRLPASSGENDSEPDAAASVRKPASRQPVPTCDMTRYR